jgi:hypothetical protein
MMLYLPRSVQGLPFVAANIGCAKNAGKTTALNGYNAFYM